MTSNNIHVTRSLMTDLEDFFTITNEAACYKYRYGNKNMPVACMLLILY